MRVLRSCQLNTDIIQKSDRLLLMNQFFLFFWSQTLKGSCHYNSCRYFQNKSISSNPNMSCLETTNLLRCVFEIIDVLPIIGSNPFTCSNNKEEDLRLWFCYPDLWTPTGSPVWAQGSSNPNTEMGPQCRVCVWTPEPQRQINQRNRADLRSCDLKIFWISAWKMNRIIGLSTYLWNEWRVILLLISLCQH